jgi:hypothetical protein
MAASDIHSGNSFHHLGRVGSAQARTATAETILTKPATFMRKMTSFVKINFGRAGAGRGRRGEGCYGAASRSMVCGS